MRREFKVLFIGVLAIGLFLVGRVPTSLAQPYKVGAILELSGWLAALSKPAMEGMTTAVEKINKKGGINGRPIELITYDSQTKESEALMAYKKLVDVDKVLVTIPAMHSGFSSAISPIAESKKVPGLPLGSSRNVIAVPPWEPPADPAKVWHWTFKFAFGEDFMVTRLQEFLKKRGLTKVAWLSVNTGFGKSARDYMEKTSKVRGFTLVAVEEFAPNDTDMSLQLMKIKTSGAEAVLIYTPEITGCLAYKQAREMGMTIPIVSIASIVTRPLMQACGQHMNGLQIVAFKFYGADYLPPNDPNLPHIRDAQKAIKEKYGYELDWATLTGWDAIMVIADALKRANPDPRNVVDARKKIRDAIENTPKDFAGGITQVGGLNKWHEFLIDYRDFMVKDGKVVPLGW